MAIEDRVNVDESPHTSDEVGIIYLSGAAEPVGTQAPATDDEVAAYEKAQAEDEKAISAAAAKWREGRDESRTQLLERFEAETGDDKIATLLEIHELDSGKTKSKK